MPVFGTHPLLAECLARILRHTPADVPVLVAVDAGPGDAAAVLAAAEVEQPRHDLVFYWRQPKNRGYVENVNDAFAAAVGADLVVVNSDCLVAPNWFRDLRAAAYSSASAGTATPLTNHGTIVSVPDRNRARSSLPRGIDVDEAARRVASASPRLRPVLPTAIGHCTYFRRSALDAVGTFDTAFSPGYGEETDFSRRLVASGFTNVLADDVLVYHQGGASFEATPETLAIRVKHEWMLEQRHPGFRREEFMARRSRTSPLARSLAAATGALTGTRPRLLPPWLRPAEAVALSLTWPISQAIRRHSSS